MDLLYQSNSNATAGTVAQRAAAFNKPSGGAPIMNMQAHYAALRAQEAADDKARRDALAALHAFSDMYSTATFVQQESGECMAPDGLTVPFDAVPLTATIVDMNNKPIREPVQQQQLPHQEAATTVDTDVRSAHGVGITVPAPEPDPEDRDTGSITLPTTAAPATVTTTAPPQGAHDIGSAALAALYAKSGQPGQASMQPQHSPAASSAEHAAQARQLIDNVVGMLAATGEPMTVAQVGQGIARATGKQWITHWQPVHGHLLAFLKAHSDRIQVLKNKWVLVPGMQPPAAAMHPDGAVLSNISGAQPVQTQGPKPGSPTLDDLLANIDVGSKALTSSGTAPTRPSQPSLAQLAMAAPAPAPAPAPVPAAQPQPQQQVDPFAMDFFSQAAAPAPAPVPAPVPAPAPAPAAQQRVRIGNAGASASAPSLFANAPGSSAAGQGSMISAAREAQRAPPPRSEAVDVEALSMAAIQKLLAEDQRELERQAREQRGRGAAEASAPDRAAETNERDLTWQEFQTTFKPLLLQGFVVLKHCRNGWPKRRALFATADFRAITWRTDKVGHKLMKGSDRRLEVCNMMAVVTGTDTPVMREALSRGTLRATRRECCFSIVMRHRSVDLEAGSPAQAKVLVRALKFLIAQYGAGAHGGAHTSAWGNTGGGSVRRMGDDVTWR